jgi:O-antigen ligase
VSSPTAMELPAPLRSASSPLYTLARVVLIVTICGAPWAFGAVQPWAWGGLMVLSLIALVLWAVACAQRGVLNLTWSPLYVPFLGFLILAMVQLFAGLTADHDATREAVLKIVTNLIIFFLAGQLLTQRGNGRALEWLGLVVTLLALALCILAIAQNLSGPSLRMIYWKYASPVRPFGPYVNHNDYAGLMEMLLPVSVVYILSRSVNIVLRTLLWCGVGLVISSVWICGSRGGTVALVIEGLLLAGLLIWPRPRGVSVPSLVLLLAVILASAATFYWMTSSGLVVQTAWSVFDTSRSVEATFGDRYQMGIDTLHIIRAHPGLGIGVGCFEEIIPGYITFPTDLHWTHAHDDVLEAVAETGITGALLILAALALFLRSAFWNLDNRLRYGWGWIQLGAAVGAVGLFCHSFVDFNLRVPANAAWFVVCLAVATHPRPVWEMRQKISWELRDDRQLASAEPSA